MTSTKSATWSTNGQSMVETVIVLPLVILLFLGLFYFKQITDARNNAVQAARYLTWESVWNVRELRPNRDLKDDATLQRELIAVGLGTSLVAVEGARQRRSLDDYANAVSNGARPSFADAPTFIKNLVDPQKKESVPNFNSLGGALDRLISLGGDPSFRLNDYFAEQTRWETEAENAIYSSFVAYEVPGTSVFRFLGDTRIPQTGSILGHPLNVIRTNNDAEYEAVFGQRDCIDGSSARGHIFDLWLFPSTGFPGISDVLGGSKCFISEIGSIFGIADAPGGEGGSTSILDIFGGNLGFKLPDGTLKEYPELNP